MGLKARSPRAASEVEVFLNRIRALYARVDVPLRFNSGATHARIEKYRRGSKQAFSDTLEELWRTADGTELPILARPGFSSSYSLLSLEDSLARRASMERYEENYRDYVEPTLRDPRIRPGWYHRGWVPFASSVASLWLMEDHTPQPGGCVGQIIGYVHDPDEIVWIANSLSELLPLAAAMLESDPEDYGIEW